MLRAVGLLLKWLFLKSLISERANAQKNVLISQFVLIKSGILGAQRVLVSNRCQGEKGLSQGFRTAKARQATSSETASYQSGLRGRAPGSASIPAEVKP